MLARVARAFRRSGPADPVVNVEAPVLGPERAQAALHALDTIAAHKRAADLLELLTAP